MPLEIKRDQFGYWCGDLLVTPLVNEETLATIYLQFKKDGILDTVFHERNVSLRWFLDFLMNEKTDVLACGRLKSDGSMELCGIGWINCYFQAADKLKCDVSHGFMKQFWGHGLPLTWCRLMLDWTFTSRKADVVYGVTPEPNRLAVAFARKLGFTMHGPVPYWSQFRGEACSCYIDTMTRDEWKAMEVFQEVHEESLVIVGE
jgi:RimJ/RimL family protein N-acetyltransferase